MNPSDLDPGICDLVEALRAQGVETTDSGDGSKATWMEGAMAFPHVAFRPRRGLIGGSWHDCKLALALAGRLRHGEEWQVELTVSARTSDSEARETGILYYLCPLPGDAPRRSDPVLEQGDA